MACRPFMHRFHGAGARSLHGSDIESDVESKLTDGERLRDLNDRITALTKKSLADNLFIQELLAERDADRNEAQILVRKHAELKKNLIDVANRKNELETILTDLESQLAVSKHTAEEETKARTELRKLLQESQDLAAVQNLTIKDLERQSAERISERRELLHSLQRMADILQINSDTSENPKAIEYLIGRITHEIVVMKNSMMRYEEDLKLMKFQSGEKPETSTLPGCMVYERSYTPVYDNPEPLDRQLANALTKTSGKEALPTPENNPSTEYSSYKDVLNSFRRQPKVERSGSYRKSDMQAATEKKMVLLQNEFLKSLQRESETNLRCEALLKEMISLKQDLVTLAQEQRYGQDRGYSVLYPPIVTDVTTCFTTDQQIAISSNVIATAGAGDGAHCEEIVVKRNAKADRSGRRKKVDRKRSSWTWGQQNNIASETELTVAEPEVGGMVKYRVDCEVQGKNLGRHFILKGMGYRSSSKT